MKKNLLILGVISWLAVLYGGAFFYLNQNYNEKRWIPRIVLNLPVFIGKEANSSLQINVDSPPVIQSETDVMAFQVLFDNMPLPETDLIRPWAEETDAAQTYSRPVQDLQDKPRLAILLTDVGLDEKLFAESVIRLPSVVTLSFSPYALRLSEKIKYVRQHGFENMFDIIVEGPGALNNGGTEAIRADQTFFDIQSLFQRTYFDLNVPFVGFLATGQIPVEDEIWQQSVQQQINSFGLMYFPVDSVEWMDKEKLYTVAIEKALEQAKEKAIENGQFVLALPMHPVVVQVLIDWVGIKDHPDISFVPASSIIKKAE